MELKQFKIAVLPLRNKLLNYARKLTDDHSDAEDAVQEVMLKLWNLRLKLDEYHSIEALAMTMTHHTCMDIWRENIWTTYRSTAYKLPVRLPPRTLTGRERRIPPDARNNRHATTSATNHPEDERC